MDMKQQDGTRNIDKIIAKDNLWSAYEKVRKNKGAAGIDGMSVHELRHHLNEHMPEIRQSIRDGSYRPQPVKRVAIPKPDGSKRNLGIPTVLDRTIQQAILQVIEPLIDPHFADQSYGYRKGKNAHQAIEQAQRYYEEGFKVAVECDLKSYFDTIHHQRLKAFLEEFVPEEETLKLIWAFLRSGILDRDIYIETTEGAPQGGPLSPLLANVYLNRLDRELERRGHRFIRYADDFVIFVKSERAGQRVFETTVKFVEDKLGLTINHKKSKVGTATKSSILGFHIQTLMGK